MAPDVRDAFLAALERTGEGHDALTARESALLAYAEQLTSAPAAVRSDDIARLRDVGLDDLAIHDAAAVVSYFAFVNRIADGLGVELEGSADDGGGGVNR